MGDPSGDLLSLVPHQDQVPTKPGQLQFAVVVVLGCNSRNDLLATKAGLHDDAVAGLHRGASTFGIDPASGTVQVVVESDEDASRIQREYGDLVQVEVVPEIPGDPARLLAYTNLGLAEALNPPRSDEELRDFSKSAVVAELVDARITAEPGEHLILQPGELRADFRCPTSSEVHGRP